MNQELEKKLNFYRILFIFAAIFNILSGLMLLFGYNYIFQSNGYNVPFSLVWTIQFIGLIIIFGIGYLILGINPSKNRYIAFLGIIGKLYVFTVFLILTLLMFVPPIATMVTIIDVIFAIFFIEYLIFMKKNEND